MNFSFSEEQIQIRDAAKEYAIKSIKPSVAERDREEKFPKEIIKELGELGYFGMLVPIEQGGVGFDSISYSLAIEEFSKIDASVGVILSITNSLVAYCLSKNASTFQKEKYLKNLAEGQYLGAFALSEAGSGSDAASLRTTAIKNEDFYLLNGEKMWISSAQNADVFIVFARTNPDIKGAKGISAFIVDKTMPGLEILPKEQKMGLRSSDTCAIRFENIKVPLENLLGEEGKGFTVAMSLLDGGRIGIASQAIGIAQACLEASVLYAKERTQFGQAIANYQMIQFKLAKMATKIESTKLLIYKACTLRDSGKNVGSVASMAKWQASEAAVWCAEQAIQIFGGNGYIKDYPIEKYFRDAKVTEIYEGTSEIQQIVIARNILA